MGTVRALISSGGVPIVAGSCYKVAQAWRDSETVEVEHISRRGVVTVRVVGTGVMSSGVRLDLSSARVDSFTWELLEDNRPNIEL
jgi:hypothetical protein